MSWALGARPLGDLPDLRVRLVMTTTARTTIALALAVAAFPNSPLIAVARN